MRLFFVLFIASCGSTDAPETAESSGDESHPTRSEAETSPDTRHETSPQPEAAALTRELRTVYESRVELIELENGYDLDRDSVELIEGSDCGATMRYPLPNPPNTEGVVATMYDAAGSTCEGELGTPDLLGAYRLCEGCGDGGLTVGEARWTISAPVRGCESFAGVVAVLHPEEARFVTWQPDGDEHVAELDGEQYRFVQRVREDEMGCLEGSIAVRRGGEQLFDKDVYTGIRPLLLGRIGDDVVLVVHWVGTRILSVSGEQMLHGAYVPDVNCPGC